MKTLEQICFEERGRQKEDSSLVHTIFRSFYLASILEFSKTYFTIEGPLKRMKSTNANQSIISQIQNVWPNSTLVERVLEKFARKNVPKARNINARQTLSIKCSVIWRMVFVNLPIVSTLTPKEPLEV